MSLSALSSAELPPALFGIKPNYDVLARLLILQQANGRDGAIAHTKTRSERRGSTRKLYKQKGTGNARAGSARSPVRKGGGVAFGPRNNRNHTVSMNATERRLGLASALSIKASEGSIHLLESFDTKTGAMKKTLKKPLENGSVCIFIASTEIQEARSASNIDHCNIELATHLNPMNLLKYTTIIFTPGALKEMEERFN